MKLRIASSIALAAALALGATGCSMIAPQATKIPYAPSDGIDANIAGVNVRNMMLIADESGENFNVVFTSVNETGKPVDMTVSFMRDGSASARAEFEIPEGVAQFGDPKGEQEPVLVTIPDLAPGAAVGAYFQVAGSSEVENFIPVLDGTLKDYRHYVLPADFASEDEPEQGTSVSTDPEIGKVEGSTESASE